MPKQKDPTTTQPPSYILSTMLRKSDRPLRFNTADSVLFDNGAVVAHSFTSKSGDIQKKKVVTRDSVRERFARVSLIGNVRCNPGNWASVVRYLDGTFAILDMAEFAKVTGEYRVEFLTLRPELLR